MGSTEDEGEEGGSYSNLCLIGIRQAENWGRWGGTLFSTGRPLLKPFDQPLGAVFCPRVFFSICPFSINTARLVAVPLRY